MNDSIDSSTAAPTPIVPANTNPDIQVLLRIRPLSARELHHSASAVLQFENGATVRVVDGATNNNNSGYGSSDNGRKVGSNICTTPSGGKSYNYDAVYGPDSTQVEVFHGVKGIVDAVCEGYNGTIVAYGQTGSGKTHTIFGEEGLQDNDNAGLVQRSLRAIYDKIQSQQSPPDDQQEANTIVRTTTRASFLEIYNEKIFDLFSDNLDTALSLREDALNKDVYVEHLSQHTVTNVQEALSVLRSGIDNRKVASTNMNRVSSRSHALFVLHVRTEIDDVMAGITKTRSCKFTLVDLAGSERQKNTDATGERLKEASMINNSLLCLGQVIHSLVDGSGGGNSDGMGTSKQHHHAPYRDSKLTFLLKNSFGGNSKTCLVATVSPSLLSITETVSTLKFAQRAKLIRNNAVLNEDTVGSVVALQAEIARLKQLLGKRNDVADSIADAAGRASMPSPGLPPLAPRQQSTTTDTIDNNNNNTPDNVTVQALRNQNTKLSKTVQTLKATTQHRETQVSSLKRKLQQETLIRKCKERRITYLSDKAADNIESRELAALQEEVEALRDQLENGRDVEAIEWMIKYKEVKARVEDMEGGDGDDGNGTLEAIRHQEELEATCVGLLNQKDALQTKLDTISSDQNRELDAILSDVTKLEENNCELKTALDQKTKEATQHEEKLRGNEIQLGELQEEIKKAMECMEAAQLELSNEKVKSTELQESVDAMKKKLEEELALVEEYQSKVCAAEDEMKQLNATHAESTATLQSKITELQNDINVIKDDNDALLVKMKVVTDDIAAKRDQLESLQREKEEINTQLHLSVEKESAYLEAFKLKEDEFTFEVKELKEKADALITEKASAAEKLEQVLAENSTLSSELESFKAQNTSLQEQIAKMEFVYDVVDSLEDECVFMAEERDDIEAKLYFARADLERTMRFHEVTSMATEDIHSHDLAQRDEHIKSLLHKASHLQEELNGVSDQLAKAKCDHDEKVDVMKEERESAALQIKNITDELDATKEQYAKSTEQLEQHCRESQEKISALESENEALAKDMADLQSQIKKLETERDALAEESVSFKAGVASGEEAKAQLLESQSKKEQLQSELDTTKQNEARLVEEVEALKIQLSSSAREYESLKQESTAMGEKTQSELLELQTENKRLESDCQELKSNLSSSTEEASSLKEMLTALGNDYDSLKAESSVSGEKSKSDLLEMQAENKRLELECNTMKDNETSLQQKLSSLEQEYDSFKEESAASKAQAESQLIELKADRERLESECKSLQSTEASTSKEVTSLKDKLLKLEQEYESFKEESTASQAQAESQLTELKADRERFESECKSLQSTEASTSEEVTSLKDKLLKLEQEYESFKEESTASQAQAESQLTELKADRESLESECKSLQADKASSSKEVTSLKEKLTSLEQEYELFKEKSTASQAQMESRLIKLKAEKERSESECKSLQTNEASTSSEVSSLKDKLASLEKEYESLKDGVGKLEPNTSSSPIVGVDAPVNNTFMDDSFDEDMFLPNISTPAATTEAPVQSSKLSTQKTNVTQNDENKGPSPPTPSKTPFKEKRALFSPKRTPSADKPPSEQKTAKKNTTAKKPPKRATHSKTMTTTSPIKRVTRSRSSRTPLGSKNV